MLLRVTLAFQVKAMLPRFLLRSAESGNEMGGLFPTNGHYWWPLIEDVFRSPTVLALKRSVIDEAVASEECESLSVDATLRCCLSIMGQASYRAPAATRAQVVLAR